MTLDLQPDIAAGLEALASVRGLSVEVYLQRLVARELRAQEIGPASSQESGMVVENGLLVYRTGKPLPAQIVDEAIRRSREERSQHILGDPS